MWGPAILAITLLLLPATAFAQTEKRIALLIGNQAYADTVGPLQNPHKDIALVGRALTDVGFNVLDPRRGVMRPAASEAGGSNSTWASTRPPGARTMHCATVQGTKADKQG